MTLLDIFRHLLGIKKTKRKYVKKTSEIEKLRKEAKRYLPQRLETLARKHKFKYNKLRIKNVKTRWGSCSFKNNINLNLHLMKLAPDLIDYVILHELCHTVEKNHSKKFWDLLEQHMPNAKMRRKELRKIVRM